MKRICVLILIISCVTCVSVCKMEPSGPEIIYLIPESFDGAVVVINDRDDGDLPRYVDNKYFISVPKDGILRIKPDIEKIKGIPEFRTFSERSGEKRLEYLFRRVPPDVANGRTSADISKSERDEKKFAMGYNSVNFEISGRRFSVKRFLICKVGDANRVASVDLLEKLRRVRNSFED